MSKRYSLMLIIGCISHTAMVMAQSSFRITQDMQTRVRAASVEPRPLQQTTRPPSAELRPSSATRRQVMAERELALRLRRSVQLARNAVPGQEVVEQRVAPTAGARAATPDARRPSSAGFVPRDPRLLVRQPNGFSRTDSFALAGKVSPDAAASPQDLTPSSGSRNSLDSSDEEQPRAVNPLERINRRVSFVSPVTGPQFRLGEEPISILGTKVARSPRFRNSLLRMHEEDTDHIFQDLIARQPKAIPIKDLSVLRKIFSDAQFRWLDPDKNIAIVSSCNLSFLNHFVNPAMLPIGAVFTVLPEGVTSKFLPMSDDAFYKSKNIVHHFVNLSMKRTVVKDDQDMTEVQRVAAGNKVDKCVLKQCCDTLNGFITLSKDIIGSGRKIIIVDNTPLQERAKVMNLCWLLMNGMDYDEALLRVFGNGAEGSDTVYALYKPIIKIYLSHLDKKKASAKK